MATPTYVAKKVGDQYVLERTDAAGLSSDFIRTALGGALAIAGHGRGGLLGRVVMFVGLRLVWRGLGGRRLICGPSRERAAGAPGPSYPDEHRPTQQSPQDAVEEASMESFPGSDPPARTAATRAG